MGSIRLGDQDDQRAGRNAVGLEHGDNGALVETEDVLRRGQSGIHGPAPAAARGRRGDLEHQRLPPGIHRDVEIAIEHARAVDVAAVEGECQRVAVPREVGPAGPDAVPEDVGRQMTIAPPEKRPPPQGRVPHPQRDHLLDEAEEVSVFWDERPIDPTDRVVLAPGVVIPRWVRRNSSPPRIIGTPCESSRVAMRLRAWRLRSARIWGSSVGPSTPQFQLQLASVPSRLPSPLASLCFSL